MLSKENRLSRREIEELKAKKTAILQGEFFGLIFQKQKGAKGFALIVSNKIASRAVKRNQIRRLFFRAIQGSLLNEEGKFLFLAKKSCLSASLGEFEEEMRNFRSRITN